MLPSDRTKNNFKHKTLTTSMINFQKKGRSVNTLYLFMYLMFTSFKCIKLYFTKCSERKSEKCINIHLNAVHERVLMYTFYGFNNVFAHT